MFGVAGVYERERERERERNLAGRRLRLTIFSAKHNRRREIFTSLSLLKPNFLGSDEFIFSKH